MPTVPPGVQTFLLTCRNDAREIREQHRRCRTSGLQLVDSVPDAALRELRETLPGIALVPVVHVRGEESVKEACRLAAFAENLRRAAV